MFGAPGGLYPPRRSTGAAGELSTTSPTPLATARMKKAIDLARKKGCRSVGINAEVCPDSDSRTMELGRRHTSGEECLPACVTLGNFLKIVERPGFDPSRTAFFMPTADGRGFLGGVELARFLAEHLAAVERYRLKKT